MAKNETTYFVCSYRGGERATPPRHIEGPLGFRWLIKRLAANQLRQSIAIYRDHFANPRELDYLVALLEGEAEVAPNGAASILIDKGWQADQISRLSGRLDYQIADFQQSASIDLKGADQVVVVYPDALGLGWRSLEKHLLSTGKPILVVNGRRRVFSLDRAASREMRFRRFLAETRVVELLLGVVVVGIAFVFAVYDFVSGVRRQSGKLS